MRFILIFLLLIIVLSSFVFAVSKTFDFSLTWPQVKYFGGSNHRLGFGPVKDFKNPYVVEEVRIDVGIDPNELDCRNQEGRFILKHDGNVVYTSPVLSKGSYSFPLSSPTIVDSVVFEKVSGKEDWESTNTLDRFWSWASGKTKGGDCWLTFSSTVKFSDPANYDGVANISTSCPDNCPLDLLNKSIEEAFGSRGFPLPLSGASIDIITGNKIAKDDSVMVWLGDESSFSRQSTTVFTEQAFACLDMNKDKKCDYLNAEDCTKVDGDFYDFSCCMDSSKFLPQHIRRVNKGYDSVTDAVCGLDINNKYKFAFRKDHQGVREFSDPKITLVSNGSDFFDCGSVDVSFLAKLGNVLPLSILNADRPSLGQSHVHSYLCDNNVVFECPGNDNHLSQASSKVSLRNLGDKEKGKYCTILNGWTFELDNYNSGAREQECVKAGFNWTGNYCCGEPEDLGEYYNDQYDPTRLVSIGGGCWNSTFIQRGGFVLGNNSLINYEGVFQSCNAQLSINDSYTSKILVNSNVEGAFFKSVVPKTGESATCQAFGEFTLTKNSNAPARKDASWDVVLEGFTSQHQYGYCASDQCWNMTSCVEELSDQAFYYPKNPAYSGQGFVCRP